MIGVRRLEKAEIKNRKVLLIVDYNTKELNGSVFKVDQTLPTIQYVLDKEPVVLFILTHLGRPKDRKSHSTRPLYNYLKEKISKSNKIIRYVLVSEYSPSNGIKSSKEGSILFGDNSRYYSKAELEDFYTNFDIIINDAFGCAHREAPFRAYAGFLMMKEIEALSLALGCDFLIMGGAKVSDKIKLVQQFNTTVFLGGAIATSIYKSKGYEVGSNTLVEEIVDISINNKVNNIILPVDFIVINKEQGYENKEIGAILKTDTVIDIGSKSVENLERLVGKSRFILWNGPLGKFEDPKARSTHLLVEKLIKGKARVVAGGGETTSAIFRCNASAGSELYHISTGGGAMLSFLGGKHMPGIESVEDKV
ncbi:uncharacterized protein VICG_02002 [Vittaforma corneae ATCC 50505]|uniref:Phosphoglycerate kinase n=1 Tax=Vittaforma corneae (strain ATCC 50505) TaxID=993615 RepID=L2GKZ8_VITCO|nr:uncharacterized protein VICG_02002 [Vittaforma corneae ATCC 50505]ELA40972.1 hypothetical protein VICG_02002 [Vittaforma corneae ATCC 50505]